MTRKPTPRNCAPASPPPAHWQLLLRRVDAGARAGWCADALGPGAALHFESIAELSCWLARLDDEAAREALRGPGIR